MFASGSTRCPPTANFPEGSQVVMPGLPTVAEAVAARALFGGNAGTTMDELVFVGALAFGDSLDVFVRGFMAVLVEAGVFEVDANGLVGTEFESMSVGAAYTGCIP